MILGLDISTTIVGVALINDEGNLIVSNHWDISKQESLIEKAEMVGSLLWELKTEHKIPPKEPQCLFQDLVEKL